MKSIKRKRATSKCNVYHTGKKKRKAQGELNKASPELKKAHPVSFVQLRVTPGDLSQMSIKLK
jgi:hypothetical protein